MNQSTMEEIISAIQQTNKGTEGYDTTAEVVRIEDGTAWVHIPGGVDETPAVMSVNAHVGNTVRVRVAGGQAWITGNDTSPPTDDQTALLAETMARQAIGHAATAAAAAESAQSSAAAAGKAAAAAQESADTAGEAAAQAIEDATAAKTSAGTAAAAAARAQTDATAAGTAAAAAQASADTAQADATRANTAANGALTQMSIVEDVVNVLNWISEHGTYTLTGDTEVVAGKYYFTREGEGTEVSPYVYAVVTNPESDPSRAGYYELSDVDETIANYISTHLALTDEGLYVTMDNSGYKLKLSNTGAYIIDDTGVIVGTYSNTSIIGNEELRNVHIDSDSVDVRDGQHVLASFGEATKIGQGGSSQVYMDGNNTIFYGKDGSVVGKISHGAYENHEITETVMGTTSSNGSFPDRRFSKTLQGNPGSVAELPNLSIRIRYTAQSQYTKYITFDNSESDTQTVTVLKGSSSVTLEIAYDSVSKTVSVTITDVSQNSSSGYITGIAVAANYVSKFARPSYQFGNGVTARGNSAFAEGYGTNAGGVAAHAEGYDTSSAGIASHAEGRECAADGDYSHAEGYDTDASGVCGHSEGCLSFANGNYSHAQNRCTIASGYCQTAIGQCNIEDTNNLYAFVIGNGAADDSRSNAFTVDWDGNVDIPAGADFRVNGAGVMASIPTNVSDLTNDSGFITANDTKFNEYVSKSGDTMTGNLFVETGSNPSFNHKNTAISGRVDAETLSANAAIGSIYTRDSNNEPVFYSQTYRTTGNQTYTSFIHRRYAADGSSSTNHGFYLRINNDNTKEVAFPDAASRQAWVKGLFKSNNVTSNTTVSAAAWANAYLPFTDTAGAEIGRVGVYFTTTGGQYCDIRTARVVNGSTVRNELGLRIDADGTRSIYVSDASIWRAALGINNTVSVKTASSISVASASSWVWANGTTLVNSGSLAAGTYIIRGYVSFSGNSTGNRLIAIMTSNTGASPLSNMADGRSGMNATTYCNVFGVITLTAATTLYLRALQNSGAALSCNGRLEVLKIH